MYSSNSHLSHEENVEAALVAAHGIEDEPRRGEMIIAKQMIDDEPRRGEIIR